MANNRPASSTVSIQIVAHGRTARLEGLLASLPTSVDGCPVRTYVMLNLGGDTASLRVDRMLARTAPQGFAKNHNEMFTWHEAAFVVLLNDDIVPGASLATSISRLVRTAALKPEVGCVSSTLAHPGGIPQSSGGLFPRLGRDVGRGLFLGARRVPRPRAGPHEWVPFTATLLRRDAIQQVGPLDETFGMYFEDVDFCRRLRNAGWAIAVVDAPPVIHEMGGSFVDTQERWSAWRRALMLYLRKWHSRPYALAYRLAFVVAGVLNSVWTWKRWDASSTAARSWQAWSDKWRPFTPWLPRGDR